MSRRFLAVLALGASMDAACVRSTVAQTPEASSRVQFLQAMDRALTARDPIKIAALADVERWQAAGRPTLDRLTLWLPPPPITRKRGLSANEVLYEDGEGNSWRLRLRKSGDRDQWSAVVLNRPCPPKGMPRGRLGGEAGGVDAPPPAGSRAGVSEIWTPLECWPLPRSY